MNKPTYNISKALDIIGDQLYDTSKELCDGLPDGDNPEWGYDEELVKDILIAVQAWNTRQEKNL